jgi:tRNA dimethylallyltransferase
MEPGNRRRIVRALEVTLGSGAPFSSFGPGLEAYPPVAFHLVGLRIPRDDLGPRIRARFERMLAAGLLDEVVRLSQRPLSKTARQALGYRELLRHVEEGVPLEECVDEAVRRTRHFARRQEAWFRRDPRIAWIDATDNPVAVAERVLGDWEERCRTTSPTPSS